MSNQEERRLGWHFIDSTRRLRYGDCREVIDGETLSVDGTPRCCEYGMHASAEVWQALAYAPGLVLCRVEVWGSLVSQHDKFAGTHRKVLWSVPESVMWPLTVEYAKWCAERAKKSATRAADHAAACAAYAAAYAADAASRAATAATRAADHAAACAAYAASHAATAAANANAERDAQATWWAEALEPHIPR